MKKRIINYLESKLNSPRSQKSPILTLFYRGIKQRLQINYPKPYNYYLNIGTVIIIFCVAKYLYSYKKNQIDVFGYNWLVPDYVYRVREESHIYWQIVRLAKQLPTTLTYYQWDQNLMYEINRSGKHIPFHSHKGLQNSTTFTSPLHQYNFPATAQKHGRIMMYLKNLKNPYDLKNYLRYKPISIGDWIRAFYYGIYRQLGLTNRWRYDQYVSKPDLVYQFQKMKYNYLISKDRDILYQNLDKFVENFKNSVMQYYLWLWR